jgi:hypothetical protein
LNCSSSSTVIAYSIALLQRNQKPTRKHQHYEKEQRGSALAVLFLSRDLNSATMIYASMNSSDKAISREEGAKTSAVTIEFSLFLKSATGREQPALSLASSL